MKIAVLIHLLKSKGGGPRQVLELCIELQRLGHSVTLFTHDYNRNETYTNLCDQLDIRQVSDPLIPTQTQCKKRSLIRKIRDCITYLRQEIHQSPKQLADLINERFDVINIHESPANLTAPFIKKRWPDVPLVWMCNDVWHIPAGGTLLNSNDSLWKRVFIKLLLTPMLIFDRRATRCIQHIIVLDHRIEAIVKKYYKVPTSVIRSGANIEQLLAFHDASAKSTVYCRHGFDGSVFTILCASIYFAHRRFEDVIEACAILRPRYPQLRLIIVGSTKFSPDYALRIEQLIRQRSLEQIVIQIKQFLPDCDLYKYYQAADVFVFPNFNQTWGLAPIEAMVLGKPVAVSTGAGVHEIIADHDTGLLFPPKRPAELAKVIAWYIDHPAERASIARAGHKYVVQTFSWKKYAEQMLTIFETVRSP